MNFCCKLQSFAGFCVTMIKRNATDGHVFVRVNNQGKVSAGLHASLSFLTTSRRFSQNRLLGASFKDVPGPSTFPGCPTIGPSGFCSPE